MLGLHPTLDRRFLLGSLSNPPARIVCDRTIIYLFKENYVSV